MNPRKFRFTIVAAGIDPGAKDFEDRFYEAGCDDALLSVVKGAILLDFTREAKNFAHAVFSAIHDVRRTGASVVRIEPDPYVTLSDIAERTGITRQAVSLLVQGKRGPADFPPPTLRISTDSPMWDWLTVARWLHKNSRLDDGTVIVQATITRELNTIFESPHKWYKRTHRIQRVLELDG